MGLKRANLEIRWGRGAAANELAGKYLTLTLTLSLPLFLVAPLIESADVFLSWAFTG